MSLGIGIQNIIILVWKEGIGTVSFLRIHKWESEIYTGFSPALHLQCIMMEKSSLTMVREGVHLSL
jgi:hypothetical protein